MCGIAGLISHHMFKENGGRIKKSISLQNDRGNGLGAGYASYGIYAAYEQLYALHVMAQDAAGMQDVRSFIDKNFLLHYEEDIPVWNKVI